MVLSATCPVRLPGGALAWVYLSRLDWRTWVGWLDRGARTLPNGRRLRLLEPVTAATLGEVLERAEARARRQT
jgi:hypothetical protein